MKSSVYTSRLSAAASSSRTVGSASSGIQNPWGSIRLLRCNVEHQSMSWRCVLGFAGDFFTERVYHAVRHRDLLRRPLATQPGRELEVQRRPRRAAHL